MSRTQRTFSIGRTSTRYLIRSPTLAVSTAPPYKISPFGAVRRVTWFGINESSDAVSGIIFLISLIILLGSPDSWRFILDVFRNDRLWCTKCSPKPMRKSHGNQHSRKLSQVALTYLPKTASTITWVVEKFFKWWGYGYGGVVGPVITWYILARNRNVFPDEIWYVGPKG